MATGDWEGEEERAAAEPADCYGRWRGLALSTHEGALFTLPRIWSEYELQAHWFAGHFGRDFTCVDGAAVRVVQFGVWNHEAGPDFAEAAVSFDGAAPQRGCIELDPDARDWERHGHAGNPDYESVVLHIFTRRGPADFFTRSALHRNVPQVLLDLSALEGDPPNPLPEACPGRCIAALRALPEARLRAILLASAQFRLRRKSAALARIADLHGPDEALYQGLAAALGYKNNKLPFTLLSQRLPLRVLLRSRAEAAALLFGVSGFLSSTDLAALDSPTRTYLRGLWEQWWPRRAEFERLSIPAALWNLSGQRPANHPQRRLAALAQMVRHWPQIRSLARRCQPAEIETFFAQLHDRYWQRHFTVSSKTASKPTALVGSSRITDMLVNVFYPLALNSEPQRWHAFEQLPAPASNRRVDIAAIRLFGGSCPELLKNAAMQQGLLQIYEDFCMQDSSDCALCRFPEQLAGF